VGFTSGAVLTAGVGFTFGAVLAAEVGFTSGAGLAAGVGFTFGAGLAAGVGFTFGALLAAEVGFTSGADFASGLSQSTFLPVFTYSKNSSKSFLSNLVISSNFRLLIKSKNKHIEGKYLYYTPQKPHEYMK
jgi:hypothetical protein